MSGNTTSSDQDTSIEVEQLRFALQAAGVGTWDYNLLTNQAQWSTICKQLFGLPTEAQVTATRLLEQVHPDDQEWVARANALALDPTYDREHNITFRTINPSGGYRWVQAKGRTIRDAQGQLVRFSGMVQDVTQQQQAHVALEQQVYQRTQELAAINEEFALANDELIETNSLLLRSNENLQQFAYIASHDLQEPLRKIQQFGDILKHQYAAPLGDGADYLDRMQSAASRMSTLIRDLLAYSRISTQQDVSTLVSLEQVVQGVVDDLELIVQETGAVVNLLPLPAVTGDPSQLRQLFHNLLTNAIKFRATDAVPFIQISVQSMVATDLPPSVIPTRQARTYHCISVSDNGIGFDEKYLDRIFELFQRLHGKNEFSGTGIGLAICKKVVANHGGALTASSRPGQGSTFTVYLPQ